MKKFATILLLGLMVIMAGCSDDAARQDESVKMIKSDVARLADPQVDSAIVTEIGRNTADFATDFYQQIAGEDGNIIYSPLSLSLALGMTSLGAEGGTEEAMLKTLKLTVPEEQIDPGFSALLNALEASQVVENPDHDGNTFQLNIANAIWAQSGSDINQKFLDRIARYFGSGIHQVDFRQSPEVARDLINDWVEEETHQKIKDLIAKGAITDVTRIVLANAIYFNGSWLYTFPESHTSEMPFHLPDNTEVAVDMMQLKGKHLGYTAGEGYQVVTLPYLGTDFSMTLFVPEPGRFSRFEAGFSAIRLEELLNARQSTLVDLWLPKFDFETTLDAKAPLVAMGMGEAFGREADFSGLSNSDDLMITDVLQKATITVDENGTEAAAATAVIVGLKSAMPMEGVQLKIDRPFLFIIQHEPTGAILFMGRVIEP